MKKLGWECKEIYLIPASIYYGNDYYITNFIIKGPKEELEKLKQAVEEEEQDDNR